MKNLPLALQIWLVFVAIILGISILLVVLFPLALRDFFTKETYATIESSQNLLFDRFVNDINREIWKPYFFGEREQQLQNIRTVHHFVITLENEKIKEEVIPPQPFYYPRLPEEFMSKVRDEIKEQKSNSQRYTGQIEGRKIFYVITKGNIWGHKVFLVSHMWDSYREDLVQTLFKRLVLIMSSVFLLSWLPALGLAKYLSTPLMILEKRVKKLADRDWHEPVLLQRKDEIGKLGHSIEQLRNQLIRQDEAQRSFLQHISHELKTSVMVIHSYVQSICDGVYPKGDLTSTVEVIKKEAERLEKRICNLLYMTKLDYITTYKPSHETFNLTQVIEEVVDRFRWCRSELDWSLKLSPTKIKGDIEQWRVALENLFDNQIRYAKSQIAISLSHIKDNGNRVALLRTWNDGPPIEQEVMDTLFQKFSMGYKGKFGLGLAIIKRIASLHKIKIWAANEEEGVSFYFEIPIASI